MNRPTVSSVAFDVFLCHNSEDKPEVIKIADDLRKKDLRPWLDKWEIPPGTSWQTVLGEQIQSIKTAAIFVGRSGVGPWQDAEIQAIMSQFTRRHCPVIPVILASADETPELPWTLKNLHCVDFRETEPDPFEHLIWGITGVKPDDQPDESCIAENNISPESGGQDLLPSKNKQVFEIRLPGNLDQFSQEEQKKLLTSLSGLLEIGEVKLTNAVKGSIRLYVEADTEDADIIYTASHKGQLAKLGISEVRLYPAIADLPTQEQRSQLLILLDRVQEYWVEGVLKNSLYQDLLISLGRHAMTEAIEPPWNSVLELPKQRHNILLQDRNINTIFNAMGLLLILGEPGSGKTTTLLELASSLILRAKGDAKERVPVVLNLSSWMKTQSLKDWTAFEISRKYQVPKTIAHTWLEDDYLVLLLDGLDEVQTKMQPSCVAAINNFIEKFQPAGLVVCCRLMEYQWLPERLKLNGAICLDPLVLDQVEEFLDAGGSQLAGLRQALKTDPILEELSQGPLMLSIMSLAYEGVSSEDWSKQNVASKEERRQHIFGLYVERMFRRKESEIPPPSKKKMISFLSWMANGMSTRSQTVFMLEDMQPNWLVTITTKIGYGTAVALVGALIAGLFAVLLVGWVSGPIDGLIVGPIVGLIVGLGILLGCWSTARFMCVIASGGVSALIYLPSGGLYYLSGVRSFMLGDMLYLLFYNGLIIVLISGLIGGMGIGSLSEINPVETLRWKWKLFWRGAGRGFVGGLIVGGIFGGILEPIAGLYLGLILGTIGGLMGGLYLGVSDTVSTDKVSVGQGIKLSLINSALTMLIFGLIGGLIGLLIGFQLDTLILGLLLGLFVGLIGGLNRGGSAVIKHYSLRLVLWINGDTPFMLTKFLDHGTKLILLKKVGGGYVFVHRMLLEYFADLDRK